MPSFPEFHPACRVEIFDSLSSTHDEVLARARAGDDGLLWITARAQTGGRGRMGRPWISPSGNLYASFLLINAAPLADLPQLGFVAGVALFDAIADVTGSDQLARLKWPNDLVADGAKLSGLLLETSAVAPGRQACALGFGVNCASSPEGLPYPTTDLFKLTGKIIEPDEVLAALSHRLMHWLGLWREGAGFSGVRLAWLARAAHLNKSIRVRRHDAELHGIFEGIDPTGRLLLRCEKESVTIEAGDVFLS